MVVGGLPEPREDHAEAVVAMALDMHEEIAHFRWPTGDALALRIGINTGPVVAGVIGISKFSYDLCGDTVNVASRMELQEIPGTVQLTESTQERVRGRHQCTERWLDVKGKGEIRVYVLEQSGAGLPEPASRSHTQA